MILRQSRMKPMTKVGLGCFLCLSAFMLACSIIRAALTYYNGSLDYPYVWQIFWLHSEGCIGITMGSITVYRSTLVSSGKEVSNSFRAYIAKITRSITGHKGSNRSTDNTASPEQLLKKEPQVQTSRFKLPRIPSATLSGVRTLFGGAKTRPTAMCTDGSEVDVSEVDYHAFLKAPLTAPKAIAGKTFPY